MANQNEGKSSDGSDIHPITQVDDSKEDGDRVEFSPGFFEGVSTQVEPEEKPEVSCVDAPPAPLAPIVVRLLRAILPKDERKRRQAKLAKKKA